jgi:prenyltransferase beta subunit
MQRKILKFLQISFLVIILFIGTFSIVRADDITASSTSDATITASSTSDTTITNNGGSSNTLNITAGVDVPTSCSATDTTGVVHNYPADNSSNSYLAICALEAAIKNGSISSVQLSNQYPSLGLFVTSINGITANPSSQYWAIYQNGSYANSGIALLSVNTGDVIMFQLHDFFYNNLGSQVTLNIHSLINNTPIITEGSESVATLINTTTKNTFDTTKALDFLVSQQKTDGSFGSDLYTDWAAIALASNSATPKTNLDEIINYFSKNKFGGTLLTDYERHAMALMALGLNPYNTNDENYINKIIASFDGKQFGDPNQDNDDIFALIVLQNAGYTQNDSIISTDVNFILNKQNNDGSWDGSPDMTGAAIEALSAFSPTRGVGESLTKAENYLKQKQKDDGSWNDNASSTAWAIEGILAQNEKPENWTTGTNKNSPLDYLASIQDTDGGVKDLDLQTKIWETTYVASALSSKTWNQITQSFDRESLPKTAVRIATTKKNPAIAVVQKTKSPEINSPNQNTATIPNAITSSPSLITKIIPSKNWFERLLEKIF